jgi:hypothetical protein
MSYSRWSTSTWYTYWAYYESMVFKFPTRELKEKQVFEICDFPSMSITYGQIKREGVYETLMLVKKFYDESHEGHILTDFKDGEALYTETEWNPKRPTAEDLDELKTYLEAFVKDIDEHFKWYNFFKYEWLYEIRQKIKIKK